MPPRHARLAVSSVFFLNGAVFSGWYARLPQIQDDLALGPGELGVALIGAPIGLLIAQPLVGAVVGRHGSRAIVAAAPAYIATVVLPAIAVDGPTLFAAVLLTGAANGCLDIAMNAQGLAVERASGARIFNSLHAAFSYGALTGALIAAGAAAAGVAPLAQLAAMAVVGGAIVFALSSQLLRDRGNPAAPAFARPSRRLAALGAIAFCAVLAEGAVFDWSGIFLSDEAGAAAGVAPLGLAAFALSMGTGRLLGDRAAARFGSARLVRLGGALAAAGLVVALALATPAAGVAGFAVMGVGLSVVFPLALRAAGLDDDHPGPGLAAVSTVGYTGFLAGPPLIGLLAGASDLSVALLVPCALCLVAGLLAPHAEPSRTMGRTSPGVNEPRPVAGADPSPPLGRCESPPPSGR